MTELTPKQERFIQNIVSGMSQRQAYKDAYNATYDDDAIDVKACELFKQDKIQIRYKELISKLEEEAIMTAKQRMIWLTQVVNGDVLEESYYYSDGEQIPFVKKADVSTRIKAIDTLNKMSGEYVQKVEADVKNDININITLEDDDV